MVEDGAHSDRRRVRASESTQYKVSGILATALGEDTLRTWQR
jgi:hypothetical protein